MTSSFCKVHFFTTLPAASDLFHPPSVPKSSARRPLRPKHNGGARERRPVRQHGRPRRRDVPKLVGARVGRRTGRPAAVLCGRRGSCAGSAPEPAASTIAPLLCRVNANTGGGVAMRHARFQITSQCTATFQTPNPSIDDALAEASTFFHRSSHLWPSK